jgi:hypothetical protein
MRQVRNLLYLLVHLGSNPNPGALQLVQILNTFTLLAMAIYTYKNTDVNGYDRYRYP